MKTLLVCLLLIFSIIGCIKMVSDPEDKPVKKEVTYVKQPSESFIKGKRQLEVQGYKNIQETSYPLFCCAESDSFLCSTGFVAYTPNGEKVTGCICAKGCVFRSSVTIRFE